MGVCGKEQLSLWGRGNCVAASIGRVGSGLRGLVTARDVADGGLGEGEEICRRGGWYLVGAVVGWRDEDGAGQCRRP